MDNILGIKYFSAPIHKAIASDQVPYLNALKTLPLVSVILGKFKKKKLVCQVGPCSHTHKFYMTSEEKGTDVNIAIEMLKDAYSRTCKRQILITGDSDFVPIVQMVRGLGAEVFVYTPSLLPPKRESAELKKFSTHYAFLPNSLIASSQLPNPVITPTGSIRKPITW